MDLAIPEVWSPFHLHIECKGLVVCLRGMVITVQVRFVEKIAKNLLLLITFLMYENVRVLDYIEDSAYFESLVFIFAGMSLTL